MYDTYSDSYTIQDHATLQVFSYSYLQYSVSVKRNRSTHAVKHFKVGVEGDSLLLGQERFDGLDSFLEHFDKHPMIGDETGIAKLYYSCIYLVLSQHIKN